MARMTIGIETEATGALNIGFDTSEDGAQDIFAMLLAKAAQVSERNEETGETTLRDRKLGECLHDRAQGIFETLVKETHAYKVQEAAKAATRPIAPIDYTVVTP